MKQLRYIYSWLPLLLLLSLIGCNGFGGRHEKKEMNRRISLWRKDKIPYGTKVAFDELSHLFPDATISTNRGKPFVSRSYDGFKKAYIIIGETMYPSDVELNELMSFVQDGNHVFISCRSYNDTLLHTLGLRIGEGRWYTKDMDSLGVSAYDPDAEQFKHYSYPGDGFDTWFTSMDTNYVRVLGRDDSGRVNMVRISYKSGGSIIVQSAPLAFSNFFLLHKQNKGYYEQALSYIPAKSVNEVIWDDHFRYRSNSESFSAFRYILGGGKKTQPLAWAFWLLLLLFATIYLFGSKRRQRPIRLIEPLRNSSVDFVKTIGRLYFQRRDNQNLAMKMAAHFLDHVRTRWHLSTGELDGAFAERLAYRSGYSRERLATLVSYIYHLPIREHISDEELMNFYHQLEAFYKQA